ncbi:MAG TPA: hypothetical protein VKZ45_02330, partial [Vicingaceae bacterium]|nr:hypothetical protein [Vicingaceae bacterium]
MRFLSLLIIVFISINGFAQNAAINFDLQAAIKKYHNTDKKITLMVKGDVAQIKSFVIENKGTYGLSAKGFIQVKLPVNKIEAFAKNNFVEYIEYTIPNLQLLNDTMLI